MNAELAAKMKEIEKRVGMMRTWFCDECSKLAKKFTFHVDKGRPGCETCKHYEARIGVAW